VTLGRNKDTKNIRYLSTYTYVFGAIETGSGKYEGDKAAKQCGSLAAWQVSYRGIVTLSGKLDDRPFSFGSYDTESGWYDSKVKKKQRNL
jgi:hypothetical protein